MKKKCALLILLSILTIYLAKGQVGDTIGAGNAVLFKNIANNYIDLGDVYNTLQFPFSFEAWVYPNSVASLNGDIFSSDNDPNYYCGINIQQDNTGHLDVQFADDAGGGPPDRRGVVTISTLPVNKWTQIAVVSTSVTNVLIYFNGVQQNTQFDNGTWGGTTITHSAGRASIGDYYGAGYQDAYIGLIDEVSFWNIALTQSQIQATVCKKLNPNTAGLIGYWKEDEALTSDTVFDYSPAKINGLINGPINRSMSDAPIGNNSAYLYTANYSGQSIRVGSSTGDTLIASQITGTPNGVQVYAVNSPPYYTQGLKAIPKNYFGVFCINGTSPVYQATYHYSLSDGFLNSGSQDSANLDSRFDATDTPWRFLNATLSVPQQTITKTNQDTGRQEYILSFHSYLPVTAFTASELIVCEGSAITFTNKSTGTIVSTVWTFGGGSKPDTSFVSSPTAVFATPGTFRVILNESNTFGSDTLGVTVTVVAFPVVFVTTPSPQICVGQSVKLSVSGATQYKWSPATALSATSGSSVTANPTVTTTYNVIGTNPPGCSDTAVIIVIVNPLPVLTVTPQTPQICYGQSVQLTGGSAVQYSWSPATGLSATSGSSVIANPTATTTYVLYGTNATGCTDSTKSIVKVNPLPIVSVTPAAPRICIGQSVKLTGSGASLYQWSPSTALTPTTGAVVTANPTATTSYTLHGTSTLGCVDSAKFVLTVNPLPALTLTPSTAICYGQSTKLMASGASVYNWSPAKGLSAASGSSVTANPTATTTYTLTGTNLTGCIDSTSMVLTVNPLPVLTVTPQAPQICYGQSIPLTGGTAAQYQWSPSTGLTATTGATVTANPTATTTYTFYGTTSFGCNDSVKFVLKVNPLPIVVISPSSPQICYGHPVQLTGSSAAQYQWTPSTGLSASAASSVSANPAVTTTYILHETTAFGCIDSSEVIVKVNPLPVVTLLPQDSIVCNGLSVPLTATGATTYRWSPVAGLNSTTDSDVVAAPLATTTYTVYGTDKLGCTDTVTAVVDIIPNSIVITVVPKNSIICLGNSAFVTATGGINYEWSPATAITTTTGDTLTASPLVTTTYTVIGIGIGHCADTTIADIVVSPPPVISVAPPSPVMCNGQAMLLTASGALTYQWSPPTGLYQDVGSVVNAHDTITTSYTLYGTDSLGCNDSTKFTLDVKSSPVSSFTTGVPDICDPLQIQFSNRSKAGVSYQWSFGDGDSSTLSNPLHVYPQTGIYKITLISTSENDCTDTVTVADTLLNTNANTYIPNSFTPTVPGVNQVFTPNVICTAPSNYVFKIYDRWGVMVFETNDARQGWNGTYNGKLQPLGTYVYYMSVTCGTCNFFKKGNITLLR